MILTLNLFGDDEDLYALDTKTAIDLSRPIPSDTSAFGMAPTKNEKLLSVSGGNSVNCNIFEKFSPHLHATHTEFIGHIVKENLSVVNDCLRHMEMFGLCVVLEVQPELLSGEELQEQLRCGAKASEEDLVITRKILSETLIKTLGCNEFECKLWAIVIRVACDHTNNSKTDSSKSTRPVYLTKKAAEYVIYNGFEHLLVDLPSVDRDDDGGALLAHKAFFDGSMKRSLTELLETCSNVKVVPDVYVLNLHYINIQQDATLSRPVLYPLIRL